jgi:hypothetical protein
VTAPRPHADAGAVVERATPADTRSRRRARVRCAVGLAWLGGVAACYYVGSLLALWTSATP